MTQLLTQTSTTQIAIRLLYRCHLQILEAWIQMDNKKKK